MGIVTIIIMCTKTQASLRFTSLIKRLFQSVEAPKFKQQKVTAYETFVLSTVRKSPMSFSYPASNCTPNARDAVRTSQEHTD